MFSRFIDPGERGYRWMPGFYAVASSLVLTGYFAPFRPIHFVRSDAGVFLYVGQQILKGALPYAAAWDHKPPLIFYIDALGLAVAGGSPWGVWALAFVACAAAIWLCYRIGARAFGPLPGFVGAAAMSSMLVMTMEYGNMAELWALPLEAAVIWYWMKAHTSRCYFLIGVIAGLLLLLRPNLIGAPAAACLATLAHCRRPRMVLSRFGWVAAGMVIPPGVCLAYFAAHGLAGDLLQASLFYNLEYSAVTWLARAASLMPAVNILLTLGLAFPIAGALLFSALTRFRNWRGRAGLLASFCAVQLCLEAGLASISGRGYLHYFVPWAPVAGLLCAYAGYLAINLGASSPVSFIWSRTVTAGTAAVVVFLLLVHVTGFRALVQKQFDYSRDSDARVEAVAAFIESHSAADDTIYVWGYGPEVHLLTGRMSCSRYFIHTALQVHSYSDRRVIASVVHDIATACPRFILDGAHVRESLPALDPDNPSPLRSGGGYVTRELTPMIDLLRARYERIDVPGAGKWVIYEAVSRTGSATSRTMTASAAHP